MDIGSSIAKNDLDINLSIESSIEMLMRREGKERNWSMQFMQERGAYQDNYMDYQMALLRELKLIEPLDELDRLILSLSHPFLQAISDQEAHYRRLLENKELVNIEEKIERGELSARNAYRKQSIEKKSVEVLNSEDNNTEIRYLFELREIIKTLSVNDKRFYREFDYTSRELSDLVKWIRKSYPERVLFFLDPVMEVMMANVDLYDTTSSAELLNYKKGYVKNLCATGSLDCTKVGNSWAIDKRTMVDALVKRFWQENSNNAFKYEE